VWNNLGLAYKGHGRFEEAKGAYQKALEVAPSFAEASLNLGLLQLRHLQDPDAALVTLTAYMDKASSPVSAADDLLTEAKTLIESRAEEKRMLAEQARMEEEMRKQAAEAEKAAAEAEKAAAAAGPADSAAPADGAAVSEAAPDAEAAAEPEAEPEPEPEPKDEPKAKKKTKKKKKPTKKPDGPARDDNFYD
jgi:tetratricopeptide (TPR) repeat protein